MISDLVELNGEIGYLHPQGYVSVSFSFSYPSVKYRPRDSVVSPAMSLIPHAESGLC